jgi:hypothetical protein
MTLWSNSICASVHKAEDRFVPKVAYYLHVG